jgi:protein gp37
MQKSSIEWTNQTWNPVTGCTKISPGCKNCYAENIADTRFGGQVAFPEGFSLTLQPERLAQVTPRQQPKNIFVNSMSDMFHEDIPAEYLRRVCDVMMSAPQHRFQILTKRHLRMQQILSSATFQDAAQATHIWWGVSAEDRKYGLPRINTLLATPVLNRFVSFEPLLEDVGDVSLCGLDWIIIGGESGPGARSFALEWAESLVMQATRDRIACFVKQVGAKPTLGGSPFPKAPRDPKGHQMEAWPEHLRIRDFPRGMFGQTPPITNTADLIEITLRPAIRETTDMREREV